MEKDEIGGILERYEVWLQELVDYEGTENKVGFVLMTEARGTNYDSFKNAYEDIIASTNYAIHENENGNDILTNTIPIENSFIGSLTYKITFFKNPNIAGGYATNSGTYDPNEDKIMDCRFIFNEKEKEYPNVGGEDFQETVWHELQHAYVQYNVLKANHNKQTVSNRKMDNQRSVYHAFENDKYLNSIIKNTFYYTNRNEINSMMNEMIPYLSNHKEIDFTNYRKYLESIPGYDILKNLSKMQSSMDMVIKSDRNEEFTEKFGNAVLKIYKNAINRDLTPIECTKMTYRRLCNSAVYAERQFYKVLSYALEKLGRKKKVIEWHQCRTRCPEVDIKKQFDDFVESILKENK